MEKKFKRNLLWTVAGIIALVAVFTNPDHLWTASVVFGLGCVQMEGTEEDRR